MREGVVRDLERLAQQAARVDDSSTAAYASAVGHSVSVPEKWAHSTVSKFHVRYQSPVPDTVLEHTVEALVEGSDMSMVHDGMWLQCVSWSACLPHYRVTSL